MNSPIKIGETDDWMNGLTSISGPRGPNIERERSTDSGFRAFQSLKIIGSIFGKHWQELRTIINKHIRHIANIECISFSILYHYYYHSYYYYCIIIVILLLLLFFVITIFIDVHTYLLRCTYYVYIYIDAQIYMYMYVCMSVCICM